ncbi:hypothetical protein [Pseudanabaena cinerea]|nr:hypothetical protein [Pseudanabaena cinerea]
MNAPYKIGDRTSINAEIFCIVRSNDVLYTDRLITTHLCDRQ